MIFFTAIFLVSSKLIAVDMLYFVCCMLYAVCCMLYAVCCMLYALRAVMASLTSKNNDTVKSDISGITG
jgi:hypothetical protein